MLHRVLLIVLLLSTFLQPVASAPDVGEAMNQAKQQADDMQRYTADVLKQADDLSTSREFLEDINNEANKTLLQAETVPKQTLPNSPSVTEQQLQQARDDINRLLSQVQEQNPSTANKTNQRSGPKLYIFVSFSMPDKTLKRLLIQAARINATLILRGLADDSLGKTKDKIAQLLEADASGQTKLNGSFAIDPTLFQRFNITQVPTFVLTHSPAKRCNQSNCPDTDHLRLSGDTTIEYVLQTMAREAPDTLKTSAEILLNQFTERM